jgi:hypothetical protein
MARALGEVSRGELGLVALIFTPRLLGRSPDAGVERLLQPGRVECRGVALALCHGDVLVRVESCAEGRARQPSSLVPGITGRRSIEAVIFVPEAAPEAKIAQLVVHGATVLLVRGSYDDAYDLCRAACER